MEWCLRGWQDVRGYDASRIFCAAKQSIVFTSKRRPTTGRRSQNTCEAFRQHWVLAPHEACGYGCQHMGPIGNVAGVLHGAGLYLHCLKAIRRVSSGEVFAGLAHDAL